MKPLPWTTLVNHASCVHGSCYDMIIDCCDRHALHNFNLTLTNSLDTQYEILDILSKIQSISSLNGEKNSILWHIQLLITYNLSELNSLIVEGSHSVFSAKSNFTELGSINTSLTNKNVTLQLVKKMNLLWNTVALQMRVRENLYEGNDIISMSVLGLGLVVAVATQAINKNTSTHSMLWSPKDCFPITNHQKSILNHLFAYSVFV